MNFKRKIAHSAFSLAETLITLTIIGIIAAMTIPNLLIKHQEKARVTKVQTVYSQMNTAVKLAMREYGSPEDWFVEGTGMYNQTLHEEAANVFIPYLKVKQNCLGMSTTNTQKYCGAPTGIYSSPTYFANILLEDGTAVGFRIWNKTCTAGYAGVAGSGKNDTCGTFYIKLDALKKEPMKKGYNYFDFFITKNGVVPFGVAGSTLKFEKACNTSIAQPYPGFVNDNMYGCTAWVIYKGNMDYWHCTDLSWDGKDKCSK